MGLFSRNSPWLNRLFVPSRTTNTNPVAVSDDVQLTQEYAKYYNVSTKASQIHTHKDVLNPGNGFSVSLDPEFTAQAGEFLVVENLVVQASTNSAAFDNDTFTMFRLATPGAPPFVNTHFMWWQLFASLDRSVQLWAYNGTTYPANFTSKNSAGARLLIPENGSISIFQDLGAVASSYTLVVYADIWRVPQGTTL